MTWTLRTMIVTAALAPLARALAEGVAGPAGAGMFVVGLCPADGPADAEPTRYVSTGPIDPQFAPLLQDADALYAACVAAGADVTLEQCQALVTSSSIVDLEVEAVFDTLARLGLQLQQPAEAA